MILWIQKMNNAIRTLGECCSQLYTSPVVTPITPTKMYGISFIHLFYLASVIATTVTLEQVTSFNKSFLKSFCPKRPEGLEFPAINPMNHLQGSFHRAS
jgi:hypothetical protein